MKGPTVGGFIADVQNQFKPML